jgi:hypothetical protein
MKLKKVSSQAPSKNVSTYSINFPNTQTTTPIESGIKQPKSKNLLTLDSSRREETGTFLITQSLQGNSNSNKKPTSTVLPIINSKKRGKTYINTINTIDINEAAKRMSECSETPDREEVKKLYNKVFCKNHKKIFYSPRIEHYLINSDEYKLPQIDPFVEKRVKEVKEKIVFIKDIYDYVYPQVMIQKLKMLKEIQKSTRLKLKQYEEAKLKTKESNKIRIIYQDTNLYPLKRSGSTAQLHTKEPIVYHPISSVYLNQKQY